MNTESVASSPSTRPPHLEGHPGGARPRPSTAKRRSARRFIPWIIGAVVAIGIVAGLRPKPLPVEIAQVSRGPLTVSVLEEGKTRIRHRYIISPPVSGFLQRPSLRAGAPIEAGNTVLASIQAEPASLLNPRSQSEAEARVQAAEAAMNQREAELERAQSAEALAQKELARSKTLRSSGAASAREADQAESDAAMRSRELRAAEFALKIGKFELQQAQATLLQTKGVPENIGEPIKIAAPVNGFVLNVFEENARNLPAGTPIMEVGNTSDIEAEIELLSTDAAGVQPGAEVIIERWGGPKALRGKVVLVEPAAFTKISALGVEEQRVRVRVDFLDPLPPGVLLGDRYRVEARIVTWHSEDVLQIPTGALFRRGGDWMCFVADSGKAQLQKVEIRHNNGVQAEVIGGVAAGQTVILHPPDAVTAGASITARKGQ